MHPSWRPGLVTVHLPSQVSGLVSISQASRLTPPQCQARLSPSPSAGTGLTLRATFCDIRNFLLAGGLARDKTLLLEVLKTGRHPPNLTSTACVRMVITRSQAEEKKDHNSCGSVPRISFHEAPPSTSNPRRSFQCLNLDCRRRPVLCSLHPAGLVARLGNHCRAPAPTSEEQRAAAPRRFIAAPRALLPATAGFSNY